MGKGASSDDHIIERLTFLELKVKTSIQNQKSTCHLIKGNHNTHSGSPKDGNFFAKFYSFSELLIDFAFADDLGAVRNCHNIDLII